MENKIIAEFQKGDSIQGFFLIKAAACKTTNTNNKYFDFTLGDRTGEMNAKLWDVPSGEESFYTAGVLVKVRGIVTEWQNQLQLKIDRIRMAVDEDGVSLEDFAASAPYKPAYMLGEIIKYIISIKNKDIKEIVSRILNDKKEKLMHYPAAKKNHHSIRAGLLYHIMTMLRSAEKLSEVYTNLNRDLLYAGVILHDMAKVDEMDANELGMVTEYTPEGMLLGHIIQGIKTIQKVGDEMGADPEIIMLLEHMILSHHYEPEFGSPKRPMIPEGEILHYLDMIDARMYDMTKALEKTDKGTFTDRIWLLHNRQLYKTSWDDEEEEELEMGGRE